MAPAIRWRSAGGEPIVFKPAKPVTPALDPATFAKGVMEDLTSDLPEIGFGRTKGLIQASRAELDLSFRDMNQHM